ncbi:MAG: helix-turn-helix domain-containing protein [Candidatus Coproplasma sp.]
MDNYKKIFSEQLKALRNERGVTQVELALGIGVSKGLISLWENCLREPTLGNLIALSEYFEVSLDELIGKI